MTYKVNEKQKLTNMKKPNPTMVKAGQKSWITRRKNAKKLTAKVGLPREKDFGVGEFKDMVRQDVVTLMERSSVKEGLILTLSWYMFLLEKLIVKSMPKFKFSTYEFSYEVFKKVVKAAQKLPFVQTATFGEIKAAIELATKDAYAHLLLDYCGTIKKFGPEIRLAIEKDIVKKGGLIMVTLCQRGAKYSEIRLRQMIKEAGGDRYDVIYSKSYKDGDTMLTLVVERKK